MAGVARLGEQGEIGQLQFCGQFGAHRLLAGPLVREPAGIGKAGEKQDDEQGEDPCRQAGGAGGGHKAWRMAARRSSAGAP